MRDRMTTLVLGVMLAIGTSAWADTYMWEMDASEDQVNNSGVGDGSTDSAATGHVVMDYDTGPGS
jgi:hypothetical protein